MCDLQQKSIIEEYHHDLMFFSYAPVFFFAKATGAIKVVPKIGQKYQFLLKKY